jgi:hypothetical protein
MGRWAIERHSQNAGVTEATAIALGDDHACALLAHDEVRCWGRAALGQLGVDEALGDQAVPVTWLRGENLIAIAADPRVGRHACLRR